MAGVAASGLGIQSFMKYGKGSEPIFVFGDMELGIAPVRDEQIDDSCIFDLQGRRLNRIPWKGFYIRDGKKYVVK